MKKIISIITALVMVTMTAVAVADMYPTAGIIVDIDYDNDIVYVQIMNGHMYSFNSVEDYWYNDIIAMTMSDNDTRTPCDDVIVEYRYAGSLEMLIRNFAVEDMSYEEYEIYQGYDQEGAPFVF